MGTTSYIFFGLLLLPLLAFLVWVIRQDKKKNYIGLLLLLIGMVIAAYSIITLDKNFAKDKMQAAPKASSFR
ncbi:MAG: hypothetical protein REI78_15425 [Pedobacter sp.]|nr:hypothetical protein [Pedobacter sp.]MDQ8054421.1 hypothetical protein [Pedobacter sp.]